MKFQFQGNSGLQIVYNVEIQWNYVIFIVYLRDLSYGDLAHCESTISVTIYMIVRFNVHV